VLAVVPSFRHFDGAFSDVLWLEQRLMVDNEIAQNGLKQTKNVISPSISMIQCWQWYHS
jgi:hypothetical protein